MIVFRICQTKHANSLTSPGFEARWNTEGVEMLYTGGSLALSCLENLVHKTGASIWSGDFSQMEILIPDILSVEEVKLKLLDEKDLNWFKPTNFLVTQEIGDRWIAFASSPVLKVPSAIIPQEYNYLINCNHPQFAQITIKKVVKFRLDERLR